MAENSNEPKQSHNRDLLAEHSVRVAVVLIVCALGLFISSFAAGNPIKLPGIALGWGFGLEVVRAALALAILAVIIMVIVRGWGGMWPSGISTQGIDYKEISQTTAELSGDALELSQVRAEIATIIESISA